MHKSYELPTRDETKRLGGVLAECLQAGDTVLLSGPVGAGKTELARFCIRARLAEIGALEDVPSPTFTLVQVYDLLDTQIWHTDLYRLSSIDELYELGLDAAFEDSICLVEWPERLGPLRPESALSIHLDVVGDTARQVSLEWTHEKWSTMVAMLDFLER